MGDHWYVLLLLQIRSKFADMMKEADMKPQMNAYLEDLAESEVRSLAEVIDFNEKHAELELPLRNAPIFGTLSRLRCSKC